MNWSGLCASDSKAAMKDAREPTHSARTDQRDRHSCLWSIFGVTASLADDLLDRAADQVRLVLLDPMVTRRGYHHVTLRGQPGQVVL